MFIMSSPFTNSKLRVVQGGSDHKGIAAKDLILKNELLFSFTGPAVNSPSKYTIQVGPAEHMDSSELDEWRYINHSCTPNSQVCEVTSLIDSQEGSGPTVRGLVLRALRSIEPNEEITFNYCTTEYELSCPFQCYCNGPKCIGEVRGYKYIDSDERRRIDNFGVLEYLKLDSMND